MRDGSEFFISITPSFDLEISFTDTEPESIPVIIESRMFLIPGRFTSSKTSYGDDASFAVRSLSSLSCDEI